MNTVIVINGRAWTLGDEPIGSGGYGTVYPATSDDEERVIKLIPLADGSMREMNVATDVRRTANIVPVLGTGRTNTHLALLMPRADGSLRQYIGRPNKSRRLAESEALPILIDIALALDSLTKVQTPEGIGVVHRDLKPENVLMLNGSWCLTDFGIARYAAKATGPDTRRYFMSHEYAAPEQWRGDTATTETDVYALGAIAFELLMGRRPFNGPDLREQHLDSDVPPLSGASPRFAEIIEECLYKDAGARPTPDSLVRRLRNLTRTVPAQGGFEALQQANLAETIRRGQESRHDSRSQTDEQRRLTLREIAARQIEQISVELREAFLYHAPACSPVPVNKPAWELGLNQAIFAFSALSWPGQARDSLSPPTLRSDTLPFRVIAYCHLAVGKSSGQGAGYVGRAHSLWFCDAKTEGQFRWYETGFANTGPHRPGLDRSYLTTGGGSGVFGQYAPIAVAPGHEEAISALTKPEGTREWEVAWPFTALILGELDEFVNRWATWFAAASQGTLPHPSTVRTPSVQGTWRGPRPVPANEPRAGGLFRRLAANFRQQPTAEPAPTTSEPSWEWPEDVPRDAGIPRLDTYWDAIATGGDALEIWERKQRGED